MFVRTPWVLQLQVNPLDFRKVRVSLKNKLHWPWSKGAMAQVEGRVSKLRGGLWDDWKETTVPSLLTCWFSVNWGGGGGEPLCDETIANQKKKER